MTTAQIEARESLCRRILELPDDGFSQVRQYLEDMLPHFMSSHIPNAETIAAIEELRVGKGYTAHSIEELMASLHEEDD